MFSFVPFFHHVLFRSFYFVVPHILYFCSPLRFDLFLHASLVPFAVMFCSTVSIFLFSTLYTFGPWLDSICSFVFSFVPFFHHVLFHSFYFFVPHILYFCSPLRFDLFLHASLVPLQSCFVPPFLFFVLDTLQIWSVFRFDLFLHAFLCSFFLSCFVPQFLFCCSPYSILLFPLKIQFVPSR
jgi:hypothetical protein